MKSKWKLALTAVFVVVLGSLVAVPIASAHNGALTASLDCNGVVSWTVSASPDSGTFTVSDDSGLQGGGALNVGDSFSASGTFTIPTSVTSDTVTANITWDDGFVGGEPSPVTVTRPTNCTPPPPGVCTFTKGFYRNHAGVTLAAIAGMGGSVQLGNASLTAAQAQDVLNATPGKPGDMTFTSNDLLNLAQQLITAELNAARGSTPTPTAAIAAANAVITVSISGGRIALAASAGNIGDLITPLDRFNSSDDCN
jgi:hypothetical protein